MVDFLWKKYVDGIHSFTSQIIQSTKYNVRVSLKFVIQYSADAIVHTVYLFVYNVPLEIINTKDITTNSANPTAPCTYGLVDFWSNWCPSV